MDCLRGDQSKISGPLLESPSGPDFVNQTTPRRRVLVVHDEETIVTLLETALSERGYHVTTAPGPTSARGASEGADFDVLVIDVQLFGHPSGLPLALELKSRHPKLRVIFLAGLEHEGDVPDDCFYLPKPLTLAHLFEVLQYGQRDGSDDGASGETRSDHRMPGESSGSGPG